MQNEKPTASLTEYTAQDTLTGLDLVRQKQTIVGDYAVLEQAIAVMEGMGKNADYEADPAVKLLCDWWNTQAPEELQSAGLFLTYTFADEDNAFIAGAAALGEPPYQADGLAKTPCYALFEAEGKPAVVLVFYRGRIFNAENDGWAQTYYPSGKEACKIGLNVSEVDEAYSSILGLQAVREALAAALARAEAMIADDPLEIHKHPTIPFIQVGTELAFAHRDGYADDPEFFGSNDNWWFEIDRFRGNVTCRSKECALDSAEETLFKSRNNVAIRKLNEAAAIGNIALVVALAERRGYWQGKAAENERMRTMLAPAVETLKHAIQVDKFYD